MSKIFGYIAAAIGLVAGAVVTFGVILLVLLAPLTWLVMVLLGVFASMTGFTAFAIGFWPTMVAIIIVRLVTMSVAARS